MGATTGTSLPYARDAVVAVGTGDEAGEALDRALALSGFDAAIGAALGAAGDRAGAADVVVKPALPAGRAARRAGAATDTGLLEPLIARLRAAGAERISVLTSEDLADGLVPHDYGGVIGRHVAPAAWRDAAVRISFAKNATHWRLLYAGAMANVAGCLPRPGDLRRLGRDQLPVACRAVLEALPVDFALVDAWDSLDGPGTPWSRRRPNRTRAVLASPNAFALDWLAGEKMDVDPGLNPVVREGLLRWGRVRLERRGNLTPWDPWRNPTLAGAAAADTVAGRAWARLHGGGEVAWTAR